VGRIDSSARVADGARIGADVEIGPFSIVGPNVELGDGVRLHSHVHIAGHTMIGPRTVIYPFASLGSPPQSVHYHGGPTRLVIGADCDIREHVTMNTGTEDGGMETRIGDRCSLMFAVHIAHDCKIGSDVTMVNNVTLAGHCEVGSFAVISGFAVLHQFVRVGAYSFIGGGAAFGKDLVPFATATGLLGSQAGSSLTSVGRFRGVNAVGMRRRGFSREAIRIVRTALETLFADEGTMRERAGRLAAAYPDDPNVKTIVDFVRSGGKRPFLMPAKDGADDADDEE
jgi:UDP-N-acetylglucosamine acyltransferase